MIAPVHFRFVVVTLTKSSLRVEQLSKDFIRERTIPRLAAKLVEWYYSAEQHKEWPLGLNERIVHDECSDQKYNICLKSNLSLPDPIRHRDGKLIHRIRSGRSKSDRRLQLADMVCGAVGKQLLEDGGFHDLLQHKGLSIDAVETTK